AGTAATVLWNKSDPYRELRTAQREHRRSAPVWLRPAGVARLRVKNVHHRECPPREKGLRRVQSLTGRLRYELFLDQHGPALLGTRQLSAGENRAQGAERIRPLSSNQFCGVRTGL